ncbi:MAG TPA: hypothetical protein VH593_00500 [Ktedonobacteraceae bacterium]|jgi:hypothetical protein
MEFLNITGWIFVDYDRREAEDQFIALVFNGPDSIFAPYAIIPPDLDHTDAFWHNQI